MSSGKAKIRKLTPAEWAEAEALFETGEATVTILAKRFGIRAENFSRRFKRKGIISGSKSEVLKEVVRDKVAEQVADTAAIFAQKVAATKSEHYEWALLLGKMTMSEVSKSIKSQTPIADRHENLKAIERAVSALAKVRVERYACLGLDKEDVVDEGELPTLPITEMTAEEILKIQRQASEGALGDMEMLGEEDVNEVVELGEEESS